MALRAYSVVEDLVTRDSMFLFVELRERFSNMDSIFLLENLKLQTRNESIIWILFGYICFKFNLVEHNTSI